MNHFVFRVFGIALVVVINSEIGASLNYKDDCTNTACGDATLVCTNNACACADTHFVNNADDACVIKVAFDQTCDTTVTATDQCAATNQECVDDGASGFKCLCTSTYYSDGSDCQTKKALTEACTASPTDQCIENAECTTLTCSCKSSFFANKAGACAAVVTALDGNCDATDSAAEQCAVTDSECRVDGGTEKCLCKATHYVDGSACTIRKNPDIDCSATGQCVTNAECDVSGTGKCECDTGYTEKPTDTPTMCSGVVKFASLSYMYVVPILVSMMFLLR